MLYDQLRVTQGSKEKSSEEFEKSVMLGVYVNGATVSSAFPW
jgi:hypothetical protein